MFNLAIGLHRHSGSNENFCQKYGKEVTLIWQEGQKQPEEAFVAHHAFGYRHRDRDSVFTDLRGLTNSDLVQTFAIYMSNAHVVMTCNMNFNGYRKS